METKLMKVSEGLTVNVIPNKEHEFLMTTKEVAFGYGVGDSTIRRHKKDSHLELIEGKHYINAVSFTHGKMKIPSNSTLWSKRGIIRLGFNVRSKQGKLFRDWAEDLVVERIDFEESLKNGSITNLIDLVDSTIELIGSQAKLAKRCNTHSSVITHIRNRPGLVSSDMRVRIEGVCKHIQQHGIGTDDETIELLLRVPEEEVRFGLWNKLRGM